MQKEEVLIEALPYIQTYEGKTFVIKYGGAAMTEQALKSTFTKDVTLLRKIGINIVIVHGGGHEITNLSAKLGIETEFVNGQRKTDEATIKVVMMTLAGSLNKEITGLINQWGGNALGLCGVDNNLIKAQKQNRDDGADLGLVGEVTTVNTAFLNSLLNQGLIPVIAPVGVGESGEIYNINADLAAGSIAQALKAEKLVYLSDTEGVIVDGELASTLTQSRAEQLIEWGVIGGGMIPKVESAFEALNGGVNKVHFINGKVKHSLLLEIFTDEGVGTQIIRDEVSVEATANKLVTI
jgi:acetylglutamate kinase